jgi:hypothetical protein
MEQFLGSLVSYLVGLVARHPGAICLAILITGAASVLASALPAPEQIWPEKTGGGYFAYLTAYNALHIVALNWGRVFPWFRLQPNNSAKPAPPPGGSTP